MKTRIGMLLVAVALVGFNPTGVSAQWCGTWNTACGGTGKHFVATHTEGQTDNTHPQCRYLSEEPWGHAPCAVTEDIEPETYLAAHALAVEGDVAALIEMRDVLGMYLAINEQRGTVQLLNCTKESVLANFPIESELLTALLEEQQDH